MTFAAGLLPGKKYVQIVVVKENELDQYKKFWPKLNFFALPESASALGVGASRHWILQLAKRICPPSFPFCFMLDDNVAAWKAIPVGENDSFFKSLAYPIERLANGKEGTRRYRDIPLDYVLSHFQADAFRDELEKFGLIGFHRNAVGHMSTESASPPRVVQWPGLRGRPPLFPRQALVSTRRSRSHSPGSTCTRRSS